MRAGAAGEGAGQRPPGALAAALPGAAFAMVTFLAFPHPVAGGVLDLGIALAWLSPALLMLCVEGLSPRAAFRRALLLSWLAHSAILHWIYVVTVSYGHAPPLVGVVAPALLALYIAPFAGLFAGLLRFCAQRGVQGPLLAALLWTVLDHLRSFLFTGFPWATLGYAQHENAALLPLASLGGVYLLSFITVLGGAALAELLAARRRRQPAPRRAWAALAAVALLHGWGLLLGPDLASAGGQTVRVAVLQGNIDQGVKWSAPWIERTLSRYEALTREAARDGAELVVWPETAVPGALELEPELRGRITELARRERVALLVGGVGIDLHETGGRAFFDSAFAIDPQGRLFERYDKSHLVPFGEYVPFRDLIGRFVGAVASGIASGDVTAGAGPRAVTIPLADGRVLRVGAVVCFELLFPDLVRRFVADGGALLLGITNDAWYGRTGAPYQFMAITALRSAETGVWTARAANTGVSGFIDAGGRVREQTPIFEEAYRVADLPLHPEPAGATFYVRHGDVFARACWGGALLLLARAALSRAARPGMGDPRTSRD